MPKNPHADFTPTLAGYSGISPFRFWCQTALPLTYDDSLSYYELLNKVVNYLNHTIEDLTNVENNTSELAEAYDKLQKYVNDYFDDIDIEAELRNVLDGMAEDGTLDALLDPLVAERLPGVVKNQISDVVAEQIDGAVAGQIGDTVAEQLPPIVAEAIPSKVTDWLDNNVDPAGSAVMVDSSLTIRGAAADAKVTGDKLSDLKAQITLDWTSIDAPLNPERDGFVRYVDGELGGSTTSKPTIFIDIHEYSKIKYKQQATTSNSTNAGMAFYRQNESYIDGIQGLYEQSATGYAEELKETVVPPDAYYARFSTYIDIGTYGSFALYGTKVISDAVSELNETKQNKHIGIEKKDEVLIVNASGNITTKKIPLELSEYINPVVVSKADLTLNGYLSTTDGSYIAAPTSTTQRTTPFIELESGANYTVEASSINSGELTSGLRCVAIYNTDETFSRRLPGSGYSQFSLSGDEKYIRVNTNADEVYYLRVYKLSEGYKEKIQLNKDVIVPQVNKIDTTPYIHARRAIIGFIIDGEYDLNETMHDVFNSHDVKCGYAVPYNTDYPNNPITKYIKWQDEGFEILAHGNYAIPEDTSTPDETAIQRIKDSYKIMKANGFNPKGYIGSSGAVAERFIPTIKKYYSWAATTANRKTSDESCIIYGTDKPYYLWRYSMQLSSLDQMKAAVDRAIANNYLLLFYGHANSENVDNFTAENLDSLLTYIEGLEGRIETPTKAVEEYFAVRYDDIYSLINT